MNNTLINALQILAPTISETIVTTFGLANEYKLAATTIINGIAANVHISMYYTAQIYVCLLIAILIGFGVKYSNLSSLLNFVSSVDTFDFKFVLDEKQQTMLEKYLYSHQDSFNRAKPQWSNPGDAVCKYDLRGITIIKPRCPTLAGGTYHVRINDNLIFRITVVNIKAETNTPASRELLIKFNKGTIDNLMEHLSHEDAESTLYHCTGSRLLHLNINPPKNKHDITIWDGYYHSNKNHLIKWITNIDNPPVDKHVGEPHQMSIICYGPPGTGKSTIVRKAAAFTNRHIVNINLTKYKTLDSLQEAFTCYFSNGYSFAPNRVIYEISELDKTIVKLLAISERNKRREKLYAEIAFHTSVSKEDKDKDKEKDSANNDQIKEIAEYDWDLNDLLDIICGSVLPSGRMIIANCNDICMIETHCPELVRPGRLTKFHCPYGDKKMFIEMIHYCCGFIVDPATIPDSYTFIQSALCDYLSGTDKSELTLSCIIDRLTSFSPGEPTVPPHPLP